MVRGGVKRSSWVAVEKGASPLPIVGDPFERRLVVEPRSDLRRKPTKSCTRRRTANLENQQLDASGGGFAVDGHLLP